LFPQIEKPPGLGWLDFGIVVAKTKNHPKLGGRYLEALNRWEVKTGFIFNHLAAEKFLEAIVASYLN
jgi:hypothetical protein